MYGLAYRNKKGRQKNSELNGDLLKDQCRLLKLTWLPNWSRFSFLSQFIIRSVIIKRKQQTMITLIDCLVQHTNSRAAGLPTVPIDCRTQIDSVLAGYSIHIPLKPHWEPGSCISILCAWLTCPSAAFSVLIPELLYTPYSGGSTRLTILTWTQDSDLIYNWQICAETLQQQDVLVLFLFLLSSHKVSGFLQWHARRLSTELANWN